MEALWYLAPGISGSDWRHRFGSGLFHAVRHVGLCRREAIDLTRQETRQTIAILGENSVGRVADWGKQHGSPVSSRQPLLYMLEYLPSPHCRRLPKSGLLRVDRREIAEPNM